jgi:RimJ/RimL family protein N-acetyltransferase
MPDSHDAPPASLQLRLATLADLPSMMEIIDNSKRLLHADGIPQWQNGTPNEQTVTKDIDRKWAYVLELDGLIVAQAALWEIDDPDYAEIYDGEWHAGSDSAYATLHRTAVAPHYHGKHLGSALLDALIKRGISLGFHQFRIDTHELNTRMQHLIAQAGFTYSGIVRMHNNPEDLRKVYQRFV